MTSFTGGKLYATLLWKLPMQYNTHYLNGDIVPSAGFELGFVCQGLVTAVFVDESHRFAVVEQ